MCIVRSKGCRITKGKSARLSNSGALVIRPLHGASCAPNGNHPVRNKLLINWRLSDMSKIKIDVEVKKDGETLREFKGLTVNLWNTYAENLKEYGEEMLQGCFVGTSGKVNIQNQIRSYAAKRTERGEFENDDAAVVKFATALRVTVGTGSEFRREMDKQIAASDPNEKLTMEDALARYEGMKKMAKANVAKRKAE